MMRNVGCVGVDPEEVDLEGGGEGEWLVPSCYVGACEGRLAELQARLAAVVNAYAAAAAAALSAEDCGSALVLAMASAD